MPRTVSATISTEIAKTITKPFFLVYVGFSSPVYYSSGPEAVVGDFLQDESDNYYVDELGNKLSDEDTHTWTPNDMRININPDRATGTIQIQNTDYAFGQLVSTAGGIGGVAIKVYEIYGSGDIPTDDAELLFDGVGDSATGDDRWITISLKVVATDQQHPFIRCTKEIGFNHLPPDELTITWEGNKLTLAAE